MFLEHINIVGFRGINQIDLSLDDSTLLIGENAWGKSSLLDALMLLLGPGQGLYQFTERDFHIVPAKGHAEQSIQEPHFQGRQLPGKQLQIDFTFCEAEPGRYLSTRYKKLSPVWFKQSDSLYRIHYRVQGRKQPDGTIITRRTFLNSVGKELLLESVDDLVGEIIRLHPVLRLSYVGFTDRNTVDRPDTALSQQMTTLFKQLSDDPQALSDQELQQSVQVMRSLFEHYFSGKHPITVKTSNYRYNPSQMDWRSLENLNHMLSDPRNRSVRMVLLGIFASLIQAKGNMDIDPQAHPILLVEEPESRLHPIMMSVAWGMLTNLPLQKITTTNSGELLSLVSVERICRLVRESNRVATYRIGERPLSPEDGRRIAFHIRFTRASSLFSRCWLLVEGETEVWLLNELARQCGYNLESEGIKIIEFAQSGLRPLLKFADRMGIEWHVMMDGDDAGKKYAATARSQLNNQNEKERLTMLPVLDLEHFMYREGFSEVYRRNAMLPNSVHLSARKIIQKAIHRTSKPDLAIEVADEVARRGINSVPHLLRAMFATVLRLARRKGE